MKGKMITFAILILVLVVLSFQSVSALIVIPSNESIEANTSITIARSCLNDMILRNISIKRANESFTDGVQLYSAQKALEEKRRPSDYKLVEGHLSLVCEVREAALKADDELKVFIDSYNEINEVTDLSSFEEDYQKILSSFKEERFEETSSLVDEGYNKMSEIQGEQTAFNLFYKTRARTLKNFVIKNWKAILIVASMIFVALVVFWRTIRKAMLSRKLNHFYAQRKALNSLVQNLQKKYFGRGKISEFEYKTKSKRYQEMILNIDRRIPLIKEELAKIKEFPSPKKIRNKKFK